MSCGLSGWEQLAMLAGFVMATWLWSAYMYWLGRKQEREQRERMDRTVNAYLRGVRH